MVRVNREHKQVFYGLSYCPIEAARAVNEAYAIFYPECGIPNPTVS